jgi:hypothetical protein
MRFFDVPDGRFEVFLKDLGEAEAVLPWLYSSNAIKAIGDIRRFAEKIRRAIYHEADGTQRLYLDIRFTADPVSDSKQYEAGDGPYQHVEIRLVGGSNPWTWGTKARRTERDRALPWSFDAESAAIRFLPAPKVDSARHESAPPSVPYSQEGPWALLRLMASLGTPPTRRGAAIDYLIPVPGAKGTTPSDIGWRLSVTAPSDCTDWRGNPFDTDFFKPPVLPEDITLPEDIPPSKGN